MRKFLSVLIMLSFLFSQEPVLLDETGDIQESCVGTCFSDEEVQNIELHITELENNDSLNIKIIGNLESQILDYKQLGINDSTVIANYKKQIELKDLMISEIKPKWYDNKYLWYTLGVASMVIPIWAVGQIK